jgi:hypothetical protein
MAMFSDAPRQVENLPSSPKHLEPIGYCPITRVTGRMPEVRGVNVICPVSR